MNCIPCAGEASTRGVLLQYSCACLFNLILGRQTSPGQDPNDPAEWSQLLTWHAMLSDLAVGVSVSYCKKKTLADASPPSCEPSLLHCLL